MTVMEQKAIIICMHNSACMLDMADDHDPNPQRRERCMRANQGQAAMLRKAANKLEQEFAKGECSG